MMDYPTEATFPDNTLSDENKAKLKELCKGMTIKDLRDCSSFLSDKAYEMSRKLESNVTMEDFEKVLKRTEESE